MNSACLSASAPAAGQRFKHYNNYMHILSFSPDGSLLVFVTAAPSPAHQAAARCPPPPYPARDYSARFDTPSAHQAAARCPAPPYPARDYSARFDTPSAHQAAARCPAPPRPPPPFARPPFGGLRAAASTRAGPQSAPCVMKDTELEFTKSVVHACSPLPATPGGGQRRNC